MNEHHLRYSMLIEWSEEDQAYLVIFQNGQIVF